MEDESYEEAIVFAAEEKVEPEDGERIVVNEYFKMETRMVHTAGGDAICDDSMEIMFCDRKLVLSLTLTEREFEPLFSGAAWAGTRLWDAAITMCTFMKETLQLQDKSVIELGCGSGVPGMCARVLGADVILTEQESLVELLQKNVASNFVGEQGRISAAELDWGKTEAAELVKDTVFDYVIVCDCVYEYLYGKSWVKLAETIAFLSENHQTETYISFERRNGDGIDEFMECMKTSYKLTVEAISGYEVFNENVFLVKVTCPLLHA